MKFLSIGELAKQSGITVRTLRYYESKGLLEPKRSESGQRAFGVQDVVRLQQILMLKRAGFGLRAIAGMLEAGTVNARQMLEMQQVLLKKHLQQTEAMLVTVSDALRNLGQDETTDLSTLCTIIKLGEGTMSEEKWQKVWDKYYTPEEQDRWQNAKEQVPDDVREACERNWPALIARTEALLGTDPALEEAQAVLREWNTMTQVIYDVDPSLTRSAARMYDDMDNWPEDGPQPPFSKDVWAFIKAAEKASQ